MTVTRVLTLALGVACLASTTVVAESLGDIAAREKERRKGKTGGKVITEEDLRRAGGASVYIAPDDPAAGDTSSTSTPAGEAKEGGEEAKEGGAKEGAAKTAPGAPKGKTEDEIAEEKKAAWTKKLDAANAEVARIQEQVTLLESQPNIYLNAAALAQLEKAKKSLETARAQVATIEAEGRKLED